MRIEHHDHYSCLFLDKCDHNTMLYLDLHTMTSICENDIQTICNIILESTPASKFEQPSFLVLYVLSKKSNPNTNNSPNVIAHVKLDAQ